MIHLISLLITFAMANPLQCFNNAKVAKNLSDDEALSLCKGAESLAPANCFSMARSRQLPIDASIILCRRAKDDLPIKCYDQARAQLPQGFQIIDLCSMK